jgi:tetratricopeptide (TPR) repeat protein
MRVVLTLLILLAAVPARADNTSEARAHFEAGNAAYALGDYAVAAQEYEKAFALRSDPALLYNAAQAHRVAGNKPRALLLYQNYLRVYGSQVSNRAEVQRHIATLKQAIEVEQQSQSSPPTTPAPLGSAPAPAHPETTPTAPPTNAPPPTANEPPATSPTPAAGNALTATAPTRDERPLIKKPWFWAVVGGAALVVAGVGIGLGVGLSGDKNPTPSLGAVAGN